MVPVDQNDVSFALGDEGGGDRSSMQVNLFQQQGRQTVIDVLCKDGTFVMDKRKLDAQEADADHGDIDIESGIATKAVAATAKLGTIFGVFLPCMQNILGVILFLRLPFIVGQAGCVGASLIVLICVASTSMTALSLSAIATNGQIQAGGPYYVISRNLGVEIGGGLGILFYLGNTIAASMYVLGAVEAFQVSFDFKDQFFFDTQIESLVLVFGLASVVFIGVKYVNMSATVFLAVVVASITCLLAGVGLFSAGVFDGTPGAIADIDGARVSMDNMKQNYQKDPDTGITPDFFALLALFYPSVTGIMAGSNRSAILADPGRSIPTGTIGAIIVTTCIYLVAIWLFGTSLSNEILIADKLIVTAVAWPHELIVKVGIIMSCIGAGLQTMTGAPRLLAAIAEDDAIPFLRPFAPATADAEPTKALILTWFIASLPVLAGNLDFITPIITLFFLLMYSGINLSCFILSVLKAPGFRPSFKYYHWGLSLFGFFWCLGLGFIIDAYVTVASIFMFIFLYLYIRTQGAVKEWGDTVRGLRYGMARDELLALGVKDNFHAKNWRPQVLCLVDTDENGNPTKPQMLSVLGQMKKGRGLSMVFSLVKGDVVDKEVCEKAKDCRSILKLHMKEEGVPGFVEVIPTMNSMWSESVWDAVVHSGLGPMSPNSVLLSWPDDWATKGQLHKDVGKVSEAEFVKCLKGLTNLDKAIMLFKGGKNYPCAIDRVAPGSTIDIWWVVHDGGLLLLMPYLISMHRVWRHGATLRLFVVLTDSKENPIKVQESIEKHLAQVRITAKIVTVDLSNTSIAIDMRTLAEKSATLTKRRGMLRDLEGAEGDKIVGEDEEFGEKGGKTGHKTVAEVFGNMLGSTRSAGGMSERREGGADGAHIVAKSSAEQTKRVRQEVQSRKLDENRMKTAVAFNTQLLQHSSNASLVVTNLPLMRSLDHESDFCGYIEVMTEGIDSVLMVRGSGAEVVTTYG